MAANNRHKAGITLGAVTLGFLITYPFNHTFIGALLASGFSAALVGGLADWFAVTALFRKPLGIPFRTEVIPRNRERIYDDIVDLVQNKLLTKENVKTKLARYDISVLLFAYLEASRGREELKSIVAGTAYDLFLKIKPGDVGAFAENLIKDNAAEIKVAPYLAEVVEWSVANGYDDKIISFLLGELSELLRQPKVRQLLVELFEAAKRAYEGDIAGRKIVNWIIGQRGYTTERFAGLAQAKIVDLLQEMRDPLHPLRRNFKAWLFDLTVDLKTDAQFRQTIETWVTDVIKSRIDVRAAVSSAVSRLQEAAAADSSRTACWLGGIASEFDRFIENFRHNEKQRRKLDAAAKNILFRLIDSYHGKIGVLVRRQLERFDDKTLVEFIESRVGNDLQMIRISGSLVGGIAGIIIFLLTHWL